MTMTRRAWALLLTGLLLVMLALPGASLAATGRYNFVDDERYDIENNRWGSAADRIDEFLDQAFEYYLAGDTASAYDCVNNAYFCVYETTGFERQTMTYVSGPRKNAVELEFTTCKRAVKNEDLSEETQASVRQELNKLKGMIREDANKLAAKMDPAQPQTVITYWKNTGDDIATGMTQVSSDPWAALAGEEGAGQENAWTAAFTGVTEELEKANEAYTAGDTGAAMDHVRSAYYEHYESASLDRKIYSALGAEDRMTVDNAFAALRAVAAAEDADPAAWATAYGSLTAALKDTSDRIDAQEPASASYDSWTDAAAAISELIATGESGYKGKDFQTAVDSIDTAYYTVYEASGLDVAVYAGLGAEERAAVDEAFTAARSIAAASLETGKLQKTAWGNATRRLRNTVNRVAASLDETQRLADEAAAEAAKAEAEEASKNLRWDTFTGAFLIIVREGLEAILVIAAIIAYLVKSGQRQSLRPVYWGALAGILASFIAAAALYFIKQAAVAGGMAQELVEGITALIAVCVLFYVSNWMISKSEAAAWSGYIERKVQTGVEKRSSLTLAFTAFLAVFREGAEVVLFYQPMLVGDDAVHVNMVIWGFLAGCVVLVGVYFAITKLSIKLPIKVFFTATSILMAIMCVAFLGSGIKELSEGGAFEVVNRVEGIPENDVVQMFGIYPYLETLVPQLILTIILIITFLVAHYRGKLKTQSLVYEKRIADLTGAADLAEAAAVAQEADKLQADTAKMGRRN